MPCPEVVRINQLLNLLTALLDQHITSAVEKANTMAQTQLDYVAFEKLFTYCLVWALGGLFEQEDRQKF
jgi:hypothetical protein